MPEVDDLVALRSVLQIFGRASRLFANLDKSVATPLHCTEEQIQRVQQFLSYRPEDFPCRYLGVPLSIYRLKREQEQAVIDTVAARILQWRGNLLNVAGRTTLVKVMLSVIPAHTSITLCLSSWAIERIDKLRRAFIWAGAESMGGGRGKVAWVMVCRPHDLGGLGVTDLRCAGVAIRVRWPWLQFTGTDRTWRSLPSQEEGKVAALFRAATISHLGSGASTLFWVDNWLHGNSIRSLVPAMFAAMLRRKHQVSVAEALQGRAWVHHITGPRTMRVLVQFISLWNTLAQVELSPGVPDTFAWRLTADQQNSAPSAYGAMFIGSSRPLGARLIWKTSAPPRVKFFFWLVMHGRCRTAQRRHRHGLQESGACIFCDQEAESMEHIILGCVYSRAGIHV